VSDSTFAPTSNSSSRLETTSVRAGIVISIPVVVTLARHKPLPFDDVANGRRAKKANRALLV